MTLVQQSNATAGGSGSGNLYDVLELILDRGLVIDAFVRVSLVGIEILKIDVRVVVASVDTYLRFAEACNRLDLESGRKAPSQLTEIVGDMTENGAKGKSKGVLGGAVEAISDSIQGKRDDAEEEPKKRSARKSASGRKAKGDEE
ncbi:gas vesicle structural protein GvpA [Streptomyces durbertensis]|uniref:Gas vesicle protein A n=1 Tax=Streptomyces durbertensis TaxID=2448886 RepID=A0ABR6EK45_9ACTN|nr:gas vesicle structural protein GvpA [Streptomyces durbertensis]MBB1245633.1 gas vesicle structural protein GvpA [Streptomyces durbertensis]